MSRKEYAKEWRAKNKDKIAAWREKNRDKIRAKDRECYAKHKDARVQKARDWRLRALYGIDEAEYQRMVVAQDGRCALCDSDDPGGSARRFAVDHDHKDGHVRGLLCFRCNTELGIYEKWCEPNKQEQLRMYLDAQSR